MTTQQNLSHQRTGPSSTRTHSRSEPKANNATTFNTPTFEIPAVTTSGMKNIEHLIEKTYIEGKQWYRCKWQHCAYSTIRSDSIVRHMRKHTGHRPYKCLFCSYATIQSSSLKIHLRRTHTGTQAPKLHKCSFSSCRYSSTDHCKLVNHLRKRHQVEPEPINSSLNQVSDQMNAPHTSMHLNGSFYSGSSSHSLALVSGQHLSPTSLVAFPGQNINYQAMLNSNALVPGSHRKASETSLPPAFMPINFLSVLTGSGDTPNANTQDTLNADSDRTRGKSAAQHSKTAKQSGKRYNSVAAALNSQVPREENSIKRIMVLVDKRSINNKTSYCCKWPDCGYQTLRSDSIVRHIRSHTGERPFRCLYENCNYATIQRSTLNKHINRHLNSDQT